MKTREFRESDRPPLRQLYLASRRQAFPWMDSGGMSGGDFDRDTRGELVLVAVEQSVPVGFVSIWEPENFIHNLFVLPRRTGSGIGTALLRDGLARIGRPATLKCQCKNTRAVRFYESRGWRIVSDGEGPDGPFHLMQLEGPASV
jgi:GNAT superfamily N-acetyltransferase